VDFLGGEFWFCISLVGVSISYRVVDYLSLLFIKCLIQLIISYYIPTILHPYQINLVFFTLTNPVSIVACTFVSNELNNKKEGFNL